MKRILLIMIALVALTLLFAAPKTVKDPWIMNYDQAMQAAQKLNRPILVDFTGSDWCIWCKRLDGEVFSKKEFKQYADKNLVLLKLDYPRSIPQSAEVKKTNRDLLTKYGVEGFPTIVLLNSKGVEIARTGYQEGGAAKYVEHIKGLLIKK